MELNKFSEQIFGMNLKFLNLTNYKSSVQHVLEKPVQIFNISSNFEHQFFPFTTLFPVRKTFVQSHSLFQETLQPYLKWQQITKNMNFVVETLII